MAIAGAAVAFAFACAGAQAATRQVGSLTFTTTQPGAPTGAAFAAAWPSPPSADGKPPAVSEIDLDYAPGTVIDTTAAPQCKAPDAQLQLEGSSACPADTALGKGVIHADDASPAPSVQARYLTRYITLFNNQDEFIQESDDAEGTPLHAVSRAPINGTHVTFAVPAFPGWPSDGQPYTSFVSLEQSGPAIVHDGRAFMRTPPACPASGHWTNTITFIYRDGVKQTVATDAPCAAPRGATPRARHRHRRHRHHHRHRHSRRRH